MGIGDGHDLKSPRFAGDPVLEACYDNETFLENGDRGPAVEKVQKALMAAGFQLPKFGADGVFGEETKSAIKSYQQARGLKVDGIIGPNTIGRMDVEFTPTSPVTPPTPTPPVTPPTPTPPVTPPTPTPPVTPPLPRDKNGHRLHSKGLWNGSTSLTVSGGQIMHFELKNLNAIGTTIRINASTGEKKSSIILPLSTVDLEFSIFTTEPMGWKFDIETESDAFLVQWTLYSSWIPGDPPNQ